MVVVDKNRTCRIIHFAVPGDSKDWREGEREDRKVLRSKKGVTEDLECKSEDYTLVVGFLGAIPRQFGNRLKETDITAEMGQAQNTVLLGTATRILRKVLKI